MPIARFEMPDGRIGRFEVPDGTTPDQAQAMIAQSIGGGNSKPSFGESVKIGKDSFPDALRSVLQESDWGTRNIASAGTALSNLWEGAKQFVGKGDQDRIEQNQIIRDEAPLGAIAGEMALTAAPFSMVGRSLKGAGAVGAGYGAMQPVAGDQGFNNVAQGKVINSVVGGASGAAGQLAANKATDWIGKKTADMALKQAQNSQRDATLKAAQELGLVVSPAEVNPTATNRFLTGFAGKLTTQQQASAKNAEVINSAVRKEFGIPDNVALSDDVLESYRKMRGKPYQAISDLGELPVDSAFASAKKKPTITGATKSVTQYVDDFGNAIDVPPMPKADLKRNLLNEIVKAGGINKSELPDIGLEKVKRPGLFRKENGMDSDRLAEWMQQNGWVNEQDLINADKYAVGGSSDVARKLVRDAVDGTDFVFHPTEVDAAMEHSRKLYEWGEQFGNLTKQTTPGSLGNVSGKDAIEQLKDLRFNSKEYWKWFNRSGDPKARKAAASFDDAIDSLESFIERGATAKGHPDLVPELKQARKDIAKAHAVGKALNDATGNVSARALAKEKYLTGNLKTVADFAKAFPKDTQSIEQIGAMPGVSPLDFATSAISGAAGAAATGPHGLLAAGVPFLRPLVRPILTSKAYQSLMTNPSYNVPVSSRMAAGLLDYAPIGGTALAVESFR